MRASTRWRVEGVTSIRFLIAIATLVLAAGCDGSGGGSRFDSPTSPPVASIRYLQVHGTWEGTWLAYGSLPIRTTLHLGQDGSSVHGTLWMNVAGAPFNFQIRGVAAQDDGTGVGSFTWSASDPSGRIDGSMTLVESTLSGTLTLSAADDSIGGPVTLFRTSAEPGSLVSSASSGDLRWAGRRLAGIAP